MFEPVASDPTVSRHRGNVRATGASGSKRPATVEPSTKHLYHLPAHLAKHARRHWLRIDATWPWATAFTTCWQRLTDLSATT